MHMSVVGVPSFLITIVMLLARCQRFNPFIILWDSGGKYAASDLAWIRYGFDTFLVTCSPMVPYIPTILL